MNLTSRIVMMSLASLPFTIDRPRIGPENASAISAQVQGDALRIALRHQAEGPWVSADLPPSVLGLARVAVAPSVNPELSGGLELHSSGSSCEANLGGAAAEPHSQLELNALLTGYLSRCGDRLFSALDEIYEGEKRNEIWASKLERKIHELTSHLGMRIKGECHSSLCRFDFETSNAEGCSRLGQELDRPLIDSGRDTELQVSVLFRTTPTGCTRYIYSTVMPPLFLEPLRQLMKNGS